MGEDNQDQESGSGAQGTMSTLLASGGRRALIVGVVVAALGLASQILLGTIYGNEARSLTQAVIGPARSLAGGIITASSTVIALMLTILSLRTQSDSQFEASFYDRIKSTAWLGALALSSSIVFLLLLSIPIPESGAQPQEAYTIYYYLVIGSAAVLAGLFVAVVMLLYSAVESVINAVHPEIDSSLVIDPGSEKKGTSTGSGR